MLDFIVWLILFLIISGLVLLFCYWIDLFQTRNSYERGELIDFYNIILNELTRLTDSFALPAWIAMGAGITVAWFLTLFGGWISPAAAGIPDYASNLATNYFFQSILFIGVLHLMWPAFQDYAYDSASPDSFLSDLVRSEVPFMFTLGTGLAAMNLMNWGLWHKMGFLVCFGNAVTCAVYAGYRVYHYEPAHTDPYAEEGYAPEYQSYGDEEEASSEPGSVSKAKGASSVQGDRAEPLTDDYTAYEPADLDADAPEI